MLFSEPKIPQWVGERRRQREGRRFSALQRAENSSIERYADLARRDARVSVLFSEPKIPQSASASGGIALQTVSVLFSEPKIPQYDGDERGRVTLPPFQCSSASRKFLNSSFRTAAARVATVSVLFSEPKIPQCGARRRQSARRSKFQCSSASRKFLNLFQRAERAALRVFQCSSASRKFLNPLLFAERETPRLWFQCSSASRKFLNLLPARWWTAVKTPVSVLFSEPKIPQLTTGAAAAVAAPGFSALQRAENSSIR